MAWVLWDILIPLLASFALGILFGWLVWSWRRQTHDSVKNTIESTDVSSPEASIAVETDVAVTHFNEVDHSDGSKTRTLENAAVTSETNATETANIVLINERDQAKQALEKSQCDADALRERIAELEVAAQHSIDTMPTTGDARAVTEPSSLQLNADDTEHTKDKEEPDRLRQELQQLNESLERERKARRATELELLNIKNRHDKLAQEIALTVGADEHKKALNERDEKISLLEQQLNNAIDHQTDNKASLADENEPADKVEQCSDVTAPAIKSADESNIETTTENAITSLDHTDLVESGVSQAQQQAKHEVPAKNGHIPKGWTVPRERPQSKKRDKLTNIRGVGPVLEKMLNDNGIYYYDQVASLDESGLEELQLQIPQCAGRIKRDEWVQQAKELQLKKYGEMA